MNALRDLAGRWPEISALLDEALGLPAAQRAAWLDELGAERAALKDTLRELLAARARVETGDYLRTLPRLPTASANAADGIEPKPGARVGPFRLIRELGHGGMGAVWLAERADGSLKRQVALKLPHLNWARNIAERMARERDILATLEHPNIARLYDAGVDVMGRPWLALEHVQGRAIDVFARERTLDMPARLELLLQVCKAVAYAHSRLVIHRDLKPSNILVTDEGQVRLLDFGIAKLMEGEHAHETALTREAGRALTLDYASPEQIRGEPLGTASDVYSLAVVAYELLTGTRPYRLARGSAAELEEAIAHADPPPASDAAGEPPAKRQLRGDLDAILNKALKKDSAQRYASVEAFAQDLQRHIKGQPVQAQRDSLSYRVAKFIGRHRLQVSAGGAVALALLVGAGVSLWQAAQARHQAARAEAEAVALGVVDALMLGTFARIAADPALAVGAGRDAMASALRTELAQVEAKHRGQAKSMSEVYGVAATMFNILQAPSESLALGIKELEHLRLAQAPRMKIAESERQIALAYFRSGDLASALAHLEAGRAALSRASDEAARLQLSSMWRDSGSYLLQSGRYAQARTALEAAVRELEPDLRTSQHFYGSARIELARLLHQMGDDRLPQQMLDEVRTIYAGLPGLAEAEWGGLEFSEGTVWLGFGRYEEAERALRKSAAFYAKQFGEDGPYAAGNDARTARALVKLARFDEAAALVERSLAILRKASPSTDTVWIEGTFNTQAELALERGDLALAAQTLTALASLGRKPSLASLRTRMAQAQLASAQGRHEEARTTIAAARQWAAQNIPEAQRTHRSLALSAAQIEHAAGRLTEARQQLQALALPAEDGADWTPLLAADLRAAIDLQDGSTASALAWYRSPVARLAEGARTRRGPRDEALARVGFARALGAAGEAAAAQAQADIAARLLETQHADSPLRTLLGAR